VPCAAKSLKSNIRLKEQAEFLREAATLEKCRTEHVVGLIGMVTKSQPVLVLMEFMENGDLRNFLVKHRQGC